MNRREFNHEDAIAYLITWTTYGTWLPGDTRGWHKLGEGVTQPGDMVLERESKTRMQESSFLLSKSDRSTVEETVKRHCDIRKWELHAVNARSNHVHVVVTPPNYDPETVARQFKAWCSRSMKTKYRDRQRFWTERSSCRWINQDVDLDAAVIYVVDAQDRKGAN